MDALIGKPEYLFLADRALDGMARILTDLGDELANQKPDLPGANSPFAIVTHCVGMLHFWGAHVVAGRSVERDRDAEFVATGRIAELLEQVEGAKRALREYVDAADPGAPPRGAPHVHQSTPVGDTQGGALQHLFEELAQHHGHLELTRDLLRAGR